ncbi:MAG: hypothetical protein sL5_06400 [Candidatus Mesenet longicola]|uniref:Tc1-like transposase DDE domain-containing protein n=1 Tax=Candidatus Mesenet longicola TaxID=1892558 RepID=A0A8J3HUT0_9RICK|nr:MAG: hypothetical protein sGL2_06490 [Candidatus Mesenet longicola]GHM59647.1 MAG: hypothetical protein sL5_06400 [Candidatus Mesenet longicola]
MYIDEAGVDNRLYSEYGREERKFMHGQKRERISMIGKWMKRNFIAPITFTGGCDKYVFNAWLEQILLPKLPVG